MNFNPLPPTVMHIDINSAFATIEQQANPFLRGRPVVVVAYDSPNGVVLAASIEAKRFGIKTGMRLRDARSKTPNVYAVISDPNKYRFVHHKLCNLLKYFSHEVTPKSIDEFVLDFKQEMAPEMQNIAKEIKEKIRNEIGEWISVSIGISTNRQLAKVAAGIIKPDGLVEINKDNYLKIYEKLNLTDLVGINTLYETRLNSVGIHSVLDFYNASPWQLKASFRSINALYWYFRLRGYEVDNFDFKIKSIGNSYSIPKNLIAPNDLAPILAKLVNKTASRLRNHNFAAYGVHVGVTLKNRFLQKDYGCQQYYLHRGKRLKEPIFYTSDIFKIAFEILSELPIKSPVHTLSISCFSLVEHSSFQLSLFEDSQKKKLLSESIDKINRKFGDFVLTTANMLSAEEAVKDRIGFGRDLLP